MITIDHMNFELMENYRDAFDEEQFMGKYSEVLNKYDYIVGDIGYEKLRLAGFFRDNKKKVERDKKYSAIEDYLNEYCNFGCAYFVLRKVTKAEMKEKGLVAEEPDEKPQEEDVADAQETPASGLTKEVARDAETPKPESDKDTLDESTPASDGKKSDSRTEKNQKTEKGKNKNETPQNKTFASFQRDR